MNSIHRSLLFFFLCCITSTACVASGDFETEQCLAERAECSWSAVVCSPGEGADFNGADMHGVDMEKSDLRCADLRGADLHGIDLSGANLYGADLRGADLHGVDLEGANLQHADLRCADLHGTDLSRADLRDANIAGVDMHGVDMEGTQMAGAIRDDDAYRPTYATAQNAAETGEDDRTSTRPTPEEDRVGEPVVEPEPSAEPRETSNDPTRACY